MTTDADRPRPAEPEVRPTGDEPARPAWKKFRARTWAFIGVGAAAVLVGAGVAVVALSAGGGAVTAAPSDGPLYLWDGVEGQPREDAARTFAADEVLNWSGAADDVLAPLVCPAGSTGVWTFVSKPGDERAGSDGWVAYTGSGFDPEPVEAGRLEVLLPVATLGYQGLGDPDSLVATGGDYRTGVACTSGNGTTVTAAFFRSIHVEAGTGAFTVDPFDE